MGEAVLNRRLDGGQRLVGQFLPSGQGRRRRASRRLAHPAAGVSTDFIYRHPVLRPQVEALCRARSYSIPGDAAHAPGAEAAASTLVRRLIQQLAADRRKHREEVAQLRAALAAANGELHALRQHLQG
ncbi:hypothetical protein [Streptomyces sp. NPDC101234]|uniref:hypothetical protein n=1 Tax=Streptomyces sp. NPDC101234 TaxID=3366138 RepID=UPI0038100150